MKYFIILMLSIIFFSGCVAQSKNLCKEYGFSPGTRDFSTCVMSETHRSQDSWNRMGDQMREDNRASQRQIERSFDSYNLYKPSITCRTTDNLLGSVTKCD